MQIGKRNFSAFLKTWKSNASLAVDGKEAGFLSAGLSRGLNQEVCQGGSVYFTCKSFSFSLLTKVSFGFSHNVDIYIFLDLV